MNRRSEQLTGFDCGDKQCFLEHHFMQNCLIYVPTNNTECQIPCKLKGCSKEVHHFISCPVWMCLPHTTTTTSTTTTSMTTTTTASTSSSTTTRTSTTSKTTSTSTATTTTSARTTAKTTSTTIPTTSSTLSTTGSPPQTSEFEAFFYISLAFNICFLALLLIVVLKRFFPRRTNTNRNTTQRTQTVQLNPIIRQTPNTDRFFSLTESDDEGESRPLLRQTTPIPCSYSAQSERLPSLVTSAKSTTGWSWSDITLTPPIFASRTQNPEEFQAQISIAQANFLQMSTFRPIDVRNRTPNTNNETQETTV